MGTSLVISIGPSLKNAPRNQTVSSTGSLYEEGVLKRGFGRGLKMTYSLYSKPAAPSKPAVAATEYVKSHYKHEAGYKDRESSS